MQSIKQPVTHETLIKHSRFIAFLAPVFTKEDAEAFIASVKAEHPDANHHCFAYILGDEGIVQKAEDDGEPSKTAGVPMLETLKKNGLTNTVAVVVRYFGGIKLGAGGLIRAYGKSVSDALEKAVRSERTEVLTLAVVAGFEWIGTVEHLLGEYSDDIRRSYDEAVHYELRLPENKANALREALKERTGDQADCMIKKRTTEYL
ncbi:MAG: YigZ family protein [Candidatus Izemoplasmataceae bacterium]